MLRQWNGNCLATNKCDLCFLYAWMGGRVKQNILVLEPKLYLRHVEENSMQITMHV